MTDMPAIATAYRIHDSSERIGVLRSDMKTFIIRSHTFHLYISIRGAGVPQCRNMEAL
jgi:hypothetical protein